MLVGYYGALTAMDNGGDFGSGGRLDWDIKSTAASWEWDNMVMLSGRKATDWGGEETPASGSSGIPGIAATGTSTGQPSTCGPLQMRYPDRNSFDSRAMAGGAQGDRSGSADGKEGPTSAGSSPQQPSKAFLGLAAGVQEEKACKEELKQVVNGGAHDAELKLGIGKRSYCEPKAAVPSPNNNNHNNSNNNAATSKPSPSGKKPRGSSSAHTPRCQVEGCKTDLSSAKDYHRRHKVCAMHSKSAKVCVNSIDQRFCQQCSRFHVLSEFDEGKRSCRRRLAGHNERRRKPQPDPMALASTYHQTELVRRALALTRGDERLLSYGLVPPLSILGLNGYGKAAVDDYSHRSGLSLMLVPRKPSFVGSHGVHQFMQGSTSMGQTLSLSSTAETGLFAGMGPSNHLQQGGSASDPGRALSLLSSQSWASTGAPDSVASQKSSNLALEQLINENSRAAFNSSQQQACNSSGRHQNYAHDEKLIQVPHDGNSRLQQQQQQQQQTYLPTMGVTSNGYECQNLTLLQESDFGGLQHHYQQAATRPTIDLMRSNNGSSCSGGVQQQQQSGTNDFQQVLKPYGLYDQPQQPL